MKEINQRQNIPREFNQYRGAKMATIDRARFLVYDASSVGGWSRGAEHARDAPV